MSLLLALTGDAPTTACTVDTSQAQSANAAAALTLNSEDVCGQAQGASASFARSTYSYAASSQAQSAIGTFARSTYSYAASSQAQFAGGALMLAMDASMVCGQAQVVGGAIERVIACTVELSQAQSAEGLFGRLVSGGAAASQAQSIIAALSAGASADCAVASGQAQSVTANATTSGLEQFSGTLLLALMPLLYPVRRGRLIDADLTHREIRGKEILKRTPAMIAAEAHLAKLQAEAIDGASSGNTGQSLDMGSLSSGVESIGNVAVRIPRYERQVPAALPEALGASLAASDALPFELDQAMKLYVQRQAMEEDEEDVMLAITMLVRM